MRDAMTERFENLFARLAQRREGAFVPFVNLCDPDPETSLAVLETLVASGADALELGIPFSDPCADGPVVEASADRALANGATPARCLDVLRRFRTAHPETPVCLMLYINLVAAPDVRRFMQAAADAGADAVLIPDLPTSMREAEPEWDEAAREAGLHLVAIVPPNASDERVARIERIHLSALARRHHRHRPRLGHARRAHHPRPREGQGPAHPARLRHLHARTRQARARSGRRRRHRGLRPREDRLRTPRRQGRHAQGPRQRRRLLQGRHANGLKNHGPRMSIPNVFRLLKRGTRRRKLLLAPCLLHKKQRLNACNAVAKDV